ncbi:MAG: phosphatidate cytidylyltransferase [Rhizobiaceae bacterium]
MTNLQLRILSGVVLAAIVLGVTWWGGFAFRLLAVVIGAAIYVEWRKITGIENGFASRIVELGLVSAFATILVGLPPVIVFAVIAAVAILAGLLTIFGQAKVWLPVGVLYAGIPAACLAFLRGDDPQGLITILLLFAIVWSTDIFAYFVGRSMGGPKLAPKISPNKTWSGAIGGTAAAVAAGLAVAGLTGPIGNPVFPLVIVLISVFSQLGDLFESWVKRRFGVKDSGTLIPGHGGVMDRADGLVAAASALYLISAVASTA